MTTLREALRQALTIGRTHHVCSKHGTDACVDVERSMLEAAVDGLAEREATIARLRGLLSERVPDSHYAHYDPRGTAGANCPACLARGDWSSRVRDALATPDPGRRWLERCEFCHAEKGAAHNPLDDGGNECPVRQAAHLGVKLAAAEASQGRWLEAAHCPLCAPDGAPHPSGKPCACGGSRLARDAFNYVNRALVESDMRHERWLEAVEQVRESLRELIEAADEAGGGARPMVKVARRNLAALDALR